MVVFLCVGTYPTKKEGKWAKKELGLLYFPRLMVVARSENKTQESGLTDAFTPVNPGVISGYTSRYSMGLFNIEMGWCTLWIVAIVDIRRYFFLSHLMCVRARKVESERTLMLFLFSFFHLGSVSH